MCIYIVYICVYIYIHSVFPFFPELSILYILKIIQTLFEQILQI